MTLFTKCPPKWFQLAKKYNIPAGSGYKHGLLILISALCELSVNIVLVGHEKGSLQIVEDPCCQTARLVHVQPERCMALKAEWIAVLLLAQPSDLVRCLQIIGTYNSFSKVIEVLRVSKKVLRDRQRIMHLIAICEPYIIEQLKLSISHFRRRSVSLRICQIKYAINFPKIVVVIEAFELSGRSIFVQSSNLHHSSCWNARDHPELTLVMQSWLP